MRLDLTLLGGFEARSPSGAAVTLHTKKAQALLAYCAVHPDQPQSREKLATLLWGDRETDHARNSLRQTLFILRAALPPGVVHVEGDTIAVDSRIVRVDVVEFLQSAVSGTPARLEHADGLYKGDFLDGFVVSAETFEEWLCAERERLRDIAMDVWNRLFRHQRRVGRTDAAIQTGRRLLTCDPGQESAHRALISLLMEHGRRGEAVRQYQACANALRSDFGIEPEPETQELYRQIVSGGPLAEAWPLTNRRDATDGGPSRHRALRGIRGQTVQEHYTWLLRALRAQDQARQLKEQSRQTRAQLHQHLAASRTLMAGEGRAVADAVP